jgi:hypothetical protein
MDLAVLTKVLIVVNDREVLLALAFEQLWAKLVQQLLSILPLVAGSYG